MIRIVLAILIIVSLVESFNDFLKDFPTNPFEFLGAAVFYIIILTLIFFLINSVYKDFRSRYETKKNLNGNIFLLNHENSQLIHKSRGKEDYPLSTIISSPISSQMPQKSNSKIDLIIIIGLFLLISVLALPVLNTFGTPWILFGLFMLSIKLVLLSFLYKEKQWARWIFVILFYLGGIQQLNTLIISLKTFQPIKLSMLAATVSLFYFTSAIYLAFIRKWPHQKKKKSNKFKVIASSLSLILPVLMLTFYLVDMFTSSPKYESDILEDNLNINKLVANADQTLQESQELLLINLPDHPNSQFDEEAFRKLLVNTSSFTLQEKKNIINRIPQLSQWQIDELMTVFKREAEQRDELKKKWEN